MINVRVLIDGHPFIGATVKMRYTHDGPTVFEYEVDSEGVASFEPIVNDVYFQVEGIYNDIPLPEPETKPVIVKSTTPVTYKMAFEVVQGSGEYVVDFKGVE